MLVESLESMLENPLSAVVFVVGAVLVILLAPLLIAKLVGLRRAVDRMPDTPARRVRLVVLLALVACAGISLVLEGLRPGMQVFESFGAAKRYGLPATYLLVAAALLLPLANRPLTSVRPPFWWGSFVAVIGISSILSFILQPQELRPVDIAQGLALTVGLLLIASLGFRATEWSPENKRLLMLTLGLAAVLSQVAGIGLGPFVAVVVPVAASLIYTGIRLRRFMVFAAGVVIFAILWFGLRGTATPSLAVVTQIGTCAALLVLLALPRGLRLFFAWVGAGVALFASWTFGLWELMAGNWRVTNDVTLSHRAYEAAAVWDQISEGAISLLFGMGPAATVNLLNSPDASTLSAAGRDLGAVDDVHFLTSWMLLKFGLLGLAWLLVFFCSFIAITMHVLKQPKPDIFDVFLLMCVAAGVVTSLPAATNFFANPLLPLFMGVLYARKVRSSVASEPGTKSAGLSPAYARLAATEK